MRNWFLDIVLIVLLALVALLVWQGQQRTPDPYLEKIEKSGVLRVALEPSYPPFESLQSGQIVGYDADLARAIASDMGLRVEFKTYALDTLYDVLASGKADLLISALPFVRERQAEVRYSEPYYQAGQVLVARSGNGAVTSLQDLNGKRVGLELGSSADTEARRLLRTTLKGMQLSSVYHSPEEALSAVQLGEIDAAITDNASAEAYERAHGGALTTLSPPITDEPYVVAMPAAALGVALHVNATIDRLRASGQLPGAGR